MVRLVLVCMTIVVTFGFATFAKAQDAWSDISNPFELQKLVSGKVIDSKDSIKYFRKDGNSANYFTGGTYKGLSVRKWVIKDDGKLCVAPFSKPDKVTDCYTFQRTSGKAPKYRLRSRIGLYEFKIIDTVPAKLSKAVNDKAGPLQ